MSQRNKLGKLLRKLPKMELFPILLRVVAESCGDFFIYLFINKNVAIVANVAVIFAAKKSIQLFLGLVEKIGSNHLSHDR